MFSVALFSCVFSAWSQALRYTHFEARHTHSIALTPDGSRLLAVNSPEGRLSVFDVSNGSESPALVAEIPVGLEPVAVRARNNDEVWVVNEVSDSISIVSLSRGAVIATLPAKDEPADIVFAQGKAFVACARDSILRVFDAETRQELPLIEIEGLDPRALAVSADGSKVYAAFLLSGNNTTILHRDRSPAPPAPTNPALPTPPATSLIVPTSDPRIDYTVLDRDVAVVDASTGTVAKYLSGAGTNLLDLALHPVTGDLWVANTEALNLIRFEPTLRGHFVDNRLTRYAAADDAITIYDLNDGIDYATLPNPAAQATALAQPTALLFNADGSAAWVAAFNSDRVAKIDPATGDVLARVDVRTDGGSSANMRGPRALALHGTQPRLFVLNKLSSSISVIDTATATVTAEVELSQDDLMPVAIRAGRGFLFDARLSGNGTGSCASCHLDADRDGLAWDLGDPTGAMQTVTGRNLAIHDDVLRSRIMHPMKGPMITQTLRGIPDGSILHWRGDRENVQAFNPTYDKLMGGTQLSQADIDTLADYIGALRHHPNPHRQENGMLPLSFNGANPRRGQDLFNMHTHHCGICHLEPNGTDNNIDSNVEVGSNQPLKNPPLTTVYQRMHLDPRPGKTSLTGFGLGHDGSGFDLPIVHPYVLDALSLAADFADVKAFVLCFDTGTTSLVGQSVTIGTIPSSAALTAITRFESAGPAFADVVVEGVVGGALRQYTYSRSRRFYVSTTPGEPPLTRAQLLALLSGNDTLTFKTVQPQEGYRFAGQNKRQVTLKADTYFTKSKTKPFQIPVETGVLANDTGVSTSVDSAAIISSSLQGSTTLAVDGSFSYTPFPGFNKTPVDSFTYQVQIASDSGNGTRATTVHVSTYAAAAGRYVSHLTDSSNNIVGFLDVTIGAAGSWTAKVRNGGLQHSLRGTVAADGKFVVTGKPKITATMRVTLLPTGEKEVSATIVNGTNTMTGVAVRTPFHKLLPAPAAVTTLLELPIVSSTGTAPTVMGTATLRLSKLGVASISGKLGDKTSFSSSGLALTRPGGGWVFPIFSIVYKYPPGMVYGTLEYDPNVPLEIGGNVRAVKPPQTKTGPYQSGFTLDHSVRKKPKK